MIDDPLVGQLFADRFQIETVLGRGGMGMVYQAQHTILKRQVALKVIHKNLIIDQTIAARFRREARAASRIEHPNITSIFDFGYTDDGYPYLVMEYIQGPTLAEVLTRLGPMPLFRALQILVQVADALREAHACQVVHRDIKPRNIVLALHRGQPDFVKICDFGLAKVFDLGTLGGVTQDGVTVGTPEYMSPEQCVESTSDHRTDIYSFGVLAFEMLTGMVPFTGNMYEILRAQIKTAPPSPSEICPDKKWPSQVDQMILRCLAKRPEKRYQDAGDLVSAIQNLMDQIGGLPIFSKSASGRLLAEKSTSPAHRQVVVTLIEPSVYASIEEHEQQAEKPVMSEMGKGEITESEKVRRSRALEELCFLVRDFDQGSFEISELLARKICEEDVVNELEFQLEWLERTKIEIEVATREREARLRQALIQLEHERVKAHNMKRSDSNGVDFYHPSVRDAQDLKKQLQRIEESIKSVTEKIKSLGARMERRINDIQNRFNQLRQNLILRRRIVAQREAQLLEALRVMSKQARGLDSPELKELFDILGVE